MTVQHQSYLELRKESSEEFVLSDVRPEDGAKSWGVSSS